MTQGNNALQLGLALRDRGLDAVEHNNEQWVDMMRRQARRICMVHGNVTSDELHDHAERIGWQPAHHNAYGAVFRSPGWKSLGFRASGRAQARGRIIRIWSYVG